MMLLALLLAAVAANPGLLGAVPADLRQDHGGFMKSAEWATRVAADKRWRVHLPRNLAAAVDAAVAVAVQGGDAAVLAEARARGAEAEHSARLLADRARADASASGGGSRRLDARAGRGGGGGGGGSATPFKGPMPRAVRLDLRERVRRLIVGSYDDYMQHAFPAAELRPLSCDGGEFVLVNVSLVTLVDGLDTIAVVGNASAFYRGVALVEAHSREAKRWQGKSKGRGLFSDDVTVSVFETTIRLIGGLLAAHLLAVHPEWWAAHLGSARDAARTYGGALLQVARELGERLLPAFDTPTGIPVGSINLRRGVSADETMVASLAGAGSLALEMTMLSHLTGDDRFGCAARSALLALFLRRHEETGLLGKHVDAANGAWVEENSGIGSTADSFCEFRHARFG